MGNEVSLLGSVECGEPLQLEGLGCGRLWSSLVPARYKDSNTPVSLFIREHPDTESAETRQFFDNGIKRLRQLRHPGILRYVAASSESGQTVVVTERVRPLESQLAELDAVEVLAGLRDVLGALVFLHEAAGLCHNNVCPGAVFVAAVDGGWRLGGLECAVEETESRHWIASDFAKAVKELHFVPPEDRDVMRTADVPAHARDAFAFGKLVEMCVAALEDRLPDDVAARLRSLVAETTSEALMRPQLAAFAQSGALSNELSDIAANLERLPVMSTADANTFFSSLGPRLSALPAAVVGRRLGKALLSRYVFLSPAANHHLLPSLLRPQEEGEDGGLIPADVFGRHFVPELVRAFCVHESALRLSLLRHFPAFAAAVPTASLQRVILPELLLGMRDLDGDIVSGSLRGLATVVPFLGPADVTGLTHQKFFSEGRPKREGDVGSVDKPTSLLAALKDPSAPPKSPIATTVSPPNDERRLQLEARKNERRRRLEELKAEKARKAAEELANRKSEEGTAEEEAPPESQPEEEESWDGWDDDETPAPSESGAPQATNPPNPLPGDSFAESLGSGKVDAATFRAALATVTEELQRRTTAELGTEFSVDSIQIAEKEEDYFRDMTPSMPKVNTSDAPPKARTMFDVAAADLEATANDAAWGEDDWD